MILLKKQFDLPFVKSIKFDPEKHNMKAMNHLLFITQNRHNIKDLRNDRFELLNNFTLAISHLARKQMNYNLASKILTKLINNQTISKYNNKTTNLYDLVNIFFDQQIQQQQIPTNKYLLSCMEIQTEVSKLLYSMDTLNKENSIEVLIKGISRYADTILCYSTAPLNILTNESLNEHCSRSILTLCKWFNTNSNILKDITLFNANSHNNMPFNEKTYLLNKNLKNILSLKYAGLFNKEPNLDLNSTNSANFTKLLNDNEIITGDLIDLATIICPKLAKSWYTLANWCYKLGKKSVTKAHSATTILNEEEYLKLIDILPNDLTNNEKEYAISILSKLNTKEFNLNDEDIDQSLYNDSVDLTRCLLFTKCKNLSLVCIESLIELWKNIINRIYYYHKVACKGYFMYLKLNSNDYDKKVYEDGNISATLRIVKLLVKYAKELKDDLQEGLAGL
jgi:serine/threonine-protein kinase SMG1